MNTNDSSTNKQPSDDEKWTEPRADRQPTADEEKAAEKAAKGVDVDAVAEHAEEMNEIGAEVKGEGQIEPGTS